jgi:hypothetical protein
MIDTMRTLLVSSAMLLSVASLPVSAGELETLRVSVPFPFTAGRAVLPAGDYTVSENNAHLLMIRGEKTSAMVLGSPGSGPGDERSSLAFRRTDDGYSLEAVHQSGKPASVILRPIRPER